MKSRIVSTSMMILAMIALGSRGLAQNLSGDELTGNSSEPHAISMSDDANTKPAPEAFVRLTPSGAVSPRPFRPFSRIGIDSHTGLAGAGFDIATPLSRNFNVRAGSDFFSYATTFQEEGANVAINLRMRSGHASLDWFPFGGRFRLSPQVVFANNNRVQATALIPSGSAVTLNGQNYISSYADPLHGTGLVDFRKVSPGLTFGFGNIIPRTRSRFSIPIEAGFYYAGQPGLKVTFSGSACDPTQPPSIGCQSVSQDVSFQQNLAAFIARNNHNLSYASYFPVFSVGFGYSF
jgi:hypothetical protein